MARYVLQTTISVDVEVSIEASSADEAKNIFMEKCSATFSLVDMDDKKFDVCDDSISDMQPIHVWEE